MATETTADAAIVLPDNQAGNVQVSYVEGGPGTNINLAASTTDGVVAVAGPVNVTGEAAKNFTFTFTRSAELTVENKLRNSKIVAGNGDDSVGFVAGSTLKDTVTKLDAGQDSVTFGGKIESAKVRMGADGEADVIDVESLKKIKSDKGLVIREFGAEDELIVNGKSYTSDNVGKADFKDKIIVKFD